jgi:hypothetical protein
MQVAMKNGCSRYNSGLSQSCLDNFGVIKVGGSPKVDKQMVSSELVSCFFNEVVIAVGSSVPFVGSILLSIFVVRIDWSVNMISLENFILEIFNLVDVFRSWHFVLFIFLLHHFLVIHCRLNNADVELVRDYSRCPSSSVNGDYRLIHIDSVFATPLRRFS